MSILDELRDRRRKAALRQRGEQVKRHLPEPPRPLGRRRAKPKLKPRGPDMRKSPERKQRYDSTIEARRKREGDEIAEAVLAVLQRLAGVK